MPSEPITFCCDAVWIENQLVTILTITMEGFTLAIPMSTDDLEKTAQNLMESAKLRRTEEARVKRTS